MHGRKAQHHGACHRCGWKGMVVKVRRADRVRLGTGRAYGRLCQECIADLSRHKESSAAPASGADIRTITDRDVA